MHEELESLDKNETWIFVDRPNNKKLVGCKWVFKLKERIPWVQPPRYKARLVAKRFIQHEWVDYNKICSLVVKHKSIRLILSLLACF